MQVQSAGHCSQGSWGEAWRGKKGSCVDTRQEGTSGGGIAEEGKMGGGDGMGKSHVTPGHFPPGGPRTQGGSQPFGWASCPGPRGVARAEEKRPLPALSMGLSYVAGGVLSPWDQLNSPEPPGGQSGGQQQVSCLGLVPCHTLPYPGAPEEPRLHHPLRGCPMQGQGPTGPGPSFATC